MTAHTEILKELQTYRSGEFVPKDGVGVRLESRQIRGGFYWGRGEDYCQAIDAHAHIELAAFKAFIDYCHHHKCVAVVSLLHYCHAVSIATGAWDKMALTTVMNIIGPGPDYATALLAAMRYINGGGS